MSKKCVNCQCDLEDDALFCDECGAKQPQAEPQAPNGENKNAYVSNDAPPTEEMKSRIAAGLLGVFLGTFGVHNFYLGFTKRAVLQIVLSLVTCGAAGFWGFIEGILILAKKINTDANKTPLK